MASRQQQGGANAVAADPENVPSVSEETHAKKAESGEEACRRLETSPHRACRKITAPRLSTGLWHGGTFLDPH
ncbi:hypothetical protein PG991_013713 [Apiospora marii]|uniref:Uncharacterized protein n=1 Tax=Apiospora marii TaxID=335849 RepID=A0ABR1R6S3_9PEZI